MTNLKKSYLVSAFAILALTCCVMLLSQAVMAEKSSKHDFTVVQRGEGFVPLPSGDDLDQPGIQTVKPHAYTPEELQAASKKETLPSFTVPQAVDEEGLQRGIAVPSSQAAVPGDACTNPLEITIPVGDLGTPGTWPVDFSTVPVGNGNFLGGLLVERAFYFNFTATAMGTYQIRWCDDGTVPLIQSLPNYPCGRYVVYDDAPCGGPFYTTNIIPYPMWNGSLCNGPGNATPECVAAAPPALGPIGKDYFMQDGDEVLFEIEIRMGEPLVGTLTITYVEPVYIDDCVLPREIDGPTEPAPVVSTFYQDLTGFGTDGPNCPYGIPYMQNAWFRMHCLVTGTYTVSTCNTPSCVVDPGPPEVYDTPDLVMGIWGDGCFQDDDTELAWSDDGAACPGWQAEAEFIAVAGQYYMITVGSWPWSGCPDPTVQLDISFEPLTPDNDNCADVQDLGSGDGDYFVHNIDATLDGPAANFCDPLSETCADVWYNWTATLDGYVAFDMCNLGNSQNGAWDSKINVYRGGDCLSVNPREVDPYGCSDDGCGLGGVGALVEVSCSVGEEFLIRIAGWYRVPDYPCNPGGFGFGILAVRESATSIRPPNDDCDNATGPTLLTDGVLATETGNYWNSSWSDCPTAYVDGILAMQWQVWHSFEVTNCANVRMDFCGTIETGLSRVSYTNWPQWVWAFTGCPCSGLYVAVPTAGGGYGSATSVCIGYPTTADQNRWWNFNSLLPGVYIVEASTWTTGIQSPAPHTYWLAPDYTINFMATEIECAYCAGTSNINFCPPTANGSWMSDFAFADLVKDADDGPIAGQTTPNDCHAYEDHTDMVAHVYKGITYNLDVRMRKLTTPRHLLTLDDSCTVFIDWNQNSGFAANQTELGERYTIPGTLSPIYFDRRLPITVPMDAALPFEGATETTRLRVRISVGTDGVAVACGLMPTGEVEDYTVEVAELECGDFDMNGLDAGDITFLRAYYFGYGTAPDYWQRADIDGDQAITIADIIALADALYRGGDLLCL